MTDRRNAALAEAALAREIARQRVGTKSPKPAKPGPVIVQPLFCAGCEHAHRADVQLSRAARSTERTVRRVGRIERALAAIELAGQEPARGSSAGMAGSGAPSPSERSEETSGGA